MVGLTKDELITLSTHSLVDFILRPKNIDGQEWWALYASVVSSDGISPPREHEVQTSEGTHRAWRDPRRAFDYVKECSSKSRPRFVMVELDLAEKTKGSKGK